ncbi:hypothetical protein D3C79_673110 [compost metagenome]
MSDLAAQLEADALLGQCALQGLGSFFIGAWADAVQVFDHRDLATQAPPHRTQLQANHSRTNHHQVLGHVGQRQGAGGVDNAFVVDGHTWQRGWLGARRDDDVLGLQFSDTAILGTDIDSPRPCQLTPTLDPVDLVLAEQELDALGQAGHAFVFLLHHLGEVQGRFDLDTQVGELAAHRRFIQLRGMQQCLGRHATDIQAGTAEGRAAFHTGHAHAQLTGADCGVVAARAAADDHHIIGFHCCTPG